MQITFLTRAEWCCQAGKTEELGSYTDFQGAEYASYTINQMGTQ